MQKEVSGYTYESMTFKMTRSRGQAMREIAWSDDTSLQCIFFDSRNASVDTPGQFERYHEQSRSDCALRRETHQTDE